LDRNDNRTGFFHTIDGETREIVVELADRRQLAVWSRWSPAQRLQAAAEIAAMARETIALQLRSRHPDWTEEQIDREVARRFLENRV
jgi:hypothetical protein